MMKSTNTLSGGQKQRVAIAAALAMQPNIMVLDEPFSQLDPTGVGEVLGVVKNLSAEGMTIILAEHRIHEVAPYADRIVIMNEGKIVLDKAAREIFRHLDLFRQLGLRIPVNPDPALKHGALGFPRIYSIHPRDKSRGFLRGGVNTGPSDKENPPLPPFGKGGLGGFSSGKRGRGRAWLARNPWQPVGPRENKPGENTRRQGEKVVEVRNLWFSYNPKKANNGREWVLKGIDLDIFTGEVVAIMGDNGSGKTTLLHHFAGLLKPHKGSVKVAGREVKNAYRLAGTAGIVFQNPGLMLFCNTVYQEIAFGPENLKMGREETKKRVSECLRSMELEELSNYHPQTLSGGQRLRCAVAAILSMNPQIILLDEPTSGQDFLHIRRLMELFRQLTGLGKTVAFTTHDREVALEYADRILIMDEGIIYNQV
jgi:energy-coupling factor transport system ATP-binding protein